MEKQPQVRLFRTLQPYSTLPKTHKTLPRTPRKARSLWPPRPVLNRTLLCRRILQPLCSARSYPCGEHMQTREHIIRDCPRYNGYREGLCKVSRDIHLPDILGTKEGIETLALFLEKSGAFGCIHKNRQLQKTARSTYVE